MRIAIRRANGYGAGNFLFLIHRHMSGDLLENRLSGQGQTKHPKQRDPTASTIASQLRIDHRIIHRQSGFFLHFAAHIGIDIDHRIDNIRCIERARRTIDPACIGGVSGHFHRDQGTIGRNQHRKPKQVIAALWLSLTTPKQKVE